MIVPMQTVTVLCLQSDATAALERLRELGTLHVTHLREPTGAEIDGIRRELAEYRQVAVILAPTPRSGANGPVELADLCRTVFELQRELDAECERIEEIQAEIEEWAPLGDFNPADVRALEQAGLHVQLYKAPHADKVSRPEHAVFHLINQGPAGVFFVLVGRQPLDCGGAELLRLPENSLSEMRRELHEMEQRAGALRERMAALAVHLPRVEARITQLQDAVVFAETAAGMLRTGPVAVLQGYCPEESLSAIRAEAIANGWGIRIAQPADNEAVPTLIRSPAWVRPIKAIFDMLGILPGYREIDISAVFLLFYSVFFAMLAGDAGYGLLFLGISVAVHKWVRRAPPELPRLLGTLSVCTIVWGVLTGSYFGIRFESLPAPLRGMRVAWLTNETNLMALCFLIGSVHLSVAHIWNGWRVRRSLAVLAQAGWIAITWTMYFLAGNMILGRALPGFVLPLFLVGLAAVVLFMTPLKVLKTEWPNHAMLPLSVIGNFGDVVSYVRLFAVGSAGTAISVAFNEMALSGGIPNVWAGLGAALILFLAHAMNILLTALGVIVHGVRLNTLEFSGHLGMQWTGIPFRPFRREAVGQG